MASPQAERGKRELLQNCTCRFGSVFMHTIITSRWKSKVAYYKRRKKISCIGKTKAIASSREMNESVLWSAASVVRILAIPTVCTMLQVAEKPFFRLTSAQSVLDSRCANAIHLIPYQSQYITQRAKDNVSARQKRAS